MPAMLINPLVAVDANVLMDLGERVETVIDALTTLRQRFRHPRLVIPPTAQQELVHIARHGDAKKERLRASGGIEAARRWLIVPVNLMPVGHGIVERVAEKLRGPDLLPSEEVNDSLLLAEAALVEARLLLTSDEHLRGRLYPAQSRVAQLRPDGPRHCHTRGSCAEVLLSLTAPFRGTLSRIFVK